MNQKRLIVITGVSRGIGRAMAEWFTDQGHTVCGCARSKEAIEKQQKSAISEKAYASVDVTDQQTVVKWAENIVDTFGVPDLLINNAGMIHPDADFIDVPPDRFNEVVNVNVIGAANVMRAFLPAIIAHGSGIVVNISSGAGTKGFPQISGYCTSKFAIEGLSKSVAMEVPEGVAVIPLQPGVIHTDLLDLHYGDKASNYDSPAKWVQRAGPYILQLSPDQNGQSLRIP